MSINTKDTILTPLILLTLFIIKYIKIKKIIDITKTNQLQTITNKSLNRAYHFIWPGERTGERTN